MWWAHYSRAPSSGSQPFMISKFLSVNLLSRLYIVYVAQGLISRDTDLCDLSPAVRGVANYEIKHAA